MRKSLHDHCVEQDKLHLLAQWDKGKNKGLSPKDISYGSHQKIWWRCAFGHQWQAAVYTRTGQASGCPYCAGKKLLPGFNSLAFEHPLLAQQWHPTKNAGLNPGDVPSASHRKVWWRCDQGHEWMARVNSRSRGAGCPVCSNRKVLPGVNDLATTHPEISREWNWEKNGALSPCDVVAGRHTKVWWRCQFGHEWQALIISRTSNHYGCPVCAGRKVIAGQNDLASIFPNIALQWHTTRNGNRSPENVTAFSNHRVWWRCDQGHEYQCTVAHRTQGGANCPYCANRKVLPGFNDLATKEPTIAEQWHTELNGALTPQMVTIGSNKKVWWVCPNGHVWKAVIYSRATGRKTGCPVCAGNISKNKQAYYRELLISAEGKTDDIK